MYVRIFMFSFNHRDTFLEKKLVLLLEASSSIIIRPKMASQTCEGGREGGREERL